MLTLTILNIKFDHVLEMKTDLGTVKVVRGNADDVWLGGFFVQTSRWIGEETHLGFQ